MPDVQPLLQLMCQPGISINGSKHEISFRYRKSLGLVAFLAAKPGHAFSRDQLSSLFWPNLHGGEARSNLRQLVSDIKRRFSLLDIACPLQAEREQIAFLEGVLALDTNRLLNTDNPYCSYQPGENINWDMYLHDFLPGYQLPSCEEFESWLDNQRKIIKFRQIHELQTICEEGAAAGELDLALQASEYLLIHDPLEETYIQSAMHILIRSNKYESAGQLFHDFEKRLKCELGVSPSPKTLQLYTKLQEKPGKPQTWLTKVFSSDTCQRTLVAVLRVRWVCEAGQPEEVVNQLYAAEQLAHELLVEQLSAFRAPATGAGSLYYFGWPDADADAAFHAITAAHKLHELIADQDRPFQASIALHTGQVLTDITLLTPDITGDISEEVSQLCLNTPSGEIYFSGQVARILMQRVQYEEVNRYQRASDGNISDVFRLLSIRPGESNIQLSSSQTALVEEIHKIWRRVKEKPGSCQLVKLEATAGLGKTTVAEHWFKDTLKDCPRIQISCFPISCNTPFQPFFDLRNDKNAIFPEHSHFNSRINNILTDKRKNPVNLAADLMQALLEFHPQQPNVIWLEDGHWSDSATLELLSLLIRSELFHGLILITTRPGLELSGQVSTNLSLQPLTYDEASKLLKHQQLDSRFWLTPEKENELIKQSLGNPYFLNQLFKTYTDSGEQINNAIISSLSIRLERLGQFSKIAFIAASIGQVVNKELLRTVCDYFMPMLSENISILVQDRFLIEYNDSDYRFEHNLLHTALLELMPPKNRIKYSLQIAKILEGEKNKHEDVDYTSKLATYYANAEENEKARLLWLEAGNRAFRLSAFRDAAQNFQAAIDLNIENDLQCEEHIDFLFKYSLSKKLSNGTGDQQAYQASLRALELSRQAGDNDREFKALCYLQMNAGTSTKGIALEYAELLHEKALRPEQKLISYWALAGSHFWVGDLETSKKWCRKGRKLSGTLDTRVHHPLGHEDLGVSSSLYLCWIERLQDNPEAAIREAEALLSLARDADPPSQCPALFFAGTCYHWCGDAAQAKRLALQGMEISYRKHHDLWYYVCKLLFMAASASPAHQISNTEAIQYVEAIRRTYPSGYAISTWLAVDALHYQTDSPVPMQLLDECLTDLSNSGQQFTWAWPELYRKRAMLKLHVHNQPAAAHTDLLYAQQLIAKQDSPWQASLIKKALQELSELPSSGWTT